MEIRVQTVTRIVIKVGLMNRQEKNKLECHNEQQDISQVHIVQCLILQNIIKGNTVTFGCGITALIVPHRQPFYIYYVIITKNNSFLNLGSNIHV